MANKADKSYLISNVYEAIAFDSYQRKILSELYCRSKQSMLWIQTKQGSEGWLKSMHL